MYRRLAILLALFLGLLTQAGKAQFYEVTLEAEGLPDGRYYLIQIRGDEYRMVDSTLSAGGVLSFRADTSDPRGMYRIVGNMGGSTDRSRTAPFSLEFIQAHEDVIMKTRASDPVTNMWVAESLENRMYFRFLQLQDSFRSRFGRLLPLLEIYTPQDLFFTPLSAEMVRIQSAYYDSLLLIMGQDPGSIASSLISMEMEPVFNPLENPDFEEFLKENFLTMVSFDDPVLINSQIYTRKILTYLGLFRAPGLMQSEQEEVFIKAVDRIMEKASYHQDVYDFVMNYLIDGFEQYQMEKVLVHIADNYLEGECETENEAIAKARLEKYRKMAPGNRVNDIALLDIFDSPRRLSELENEKIILIFWSSECPHCERLLPRLAEWYHEKEESEKPGLYTVSIDKSQAEWSEYVLMNELPGINTYAPEGWESTVARDYNIYATPTIFILNEEMEILAKPVTFREVVSEFGE